MRPIDADELIPLIKMGECNMYDEYCQGRNGGIAFAVERIKQMPTIEERKKGKWISLDDFRGKYNTYGYKCSECGEHSEYEEKYCPNCGADMRGESNETD